MYEIELLFKNLIFYIMEETIFTIKVIFTLKFPFMRKYFQYGEIDLKVTDSTTIQELRTMIQLQFKDFIFKGKYFKSNEDDLDDEITMEEAGVKEGSEVFLHNRHPINPQFPKSNKIRKQEAKEAKEDKEAKEANEAKEAKEAKEEPYDQK